jgi:hypothetical protein
MLIEQEQRGKKSTMKQKDLLNPEFEFVECPICKAKPGTPTLCPSCFHNREVISKLKNIIRKRRMIHEKSSIHPGS